MNDFNGVAVANALKNNNIQAFLYFTTKQPVDLIQNTVIHNMHFMDDRNILMFYVVDIVCKRIRNIGFYTDVKKSNVRVSIDKMLNLVNIQRDEEGSTMKLIMHHAIKNCDAHIIRMYNNIIAFISPDIMCIEGAIYGHYALVAPFVSIGNSYINRALESAARHGYIKIMTLLMEHGAICPSRIEFLKHTKAALFLMDCHAVNHRLLSKGLTRFYVKRGYTINNKHTATTNICQNYYIESDDD